MTPPVVGRFGAQIDTLIGANPMSLTLLDWRRQVASLYATVRQAGEDDRETALASYRRERDRLFAAHPESPLPSDERARFAGLRYWPYDPTLRFEAHVELAPASGLDAHSLGETTFPLDRIGRVDLPVGTLEVYWISVYGVASSSRSGTEPPVWKATPRDGTSLIPSRAPTLVDAAIASSSTSITHTTRHVRMTRAGSARWHPNRTGYRLPSRPASGSRDVCQSDRLPRRGG